MKFPWFKGLCRCFTRKKVDDDHLGGGFKYFYFYTYLGKIPILTNIFQMGWNHQLVMFHILLETFKRDPSELKASAACGLFLRRRDLGPLRFSIEYCWQANWICINLNPPRTSFARYPTKNATQQKSSILVMTSFCWVDGTPAKPVDMLTQETLQCFKMIFKDFLSPGWPSQISSIWSNYSDLTQPKCHQKEAEVSWNPPYFREI